MFRSKETRRKYKAGIDGEDARRRRDEIAVSLRKTAREDQVMKRRLRSSQREQSEDRENNSFNGNFSGGAKTTVSDLPRLVAGIRSHDSKQKFGCCQAIRKMLSVEKNPPIQPVLDSGAATDLLNFLSPNENAQLQFEAAWALTNIASGSSKQTSALVSMGAIPRFVSLLGNQSADVREQSVWALGNIAGDSPAHRDTVLKTPGAIKGLMNLIGPNSGVQTLRNCAWAMSNLCRGKPAPNFEYIKPMMAPLKMLLTHTDSEVITDTCWAFSYVSDDSTHDNRKIRAVINSGVIPKLISLLDHENTSIKTPALRTVGNIVTGDDRQTETVLSSNALPALKALLNSSKKSIRKETCWTISNITAGVKSQIEQVVRAGIVPPLIDMMGRAEFDVKKEAAWAIANAISGGDDKQTKYLLEQSIIQPFCDLLTCHDPKIVMLCLDTLAKILEFGKGQSSFFNDGMNKCADVVEECGGLDKIEELQRHDNEEVYEKAVDIIRNYFETEEEEDEDVTLQPNFNENSTQFSFGAATSATSGFNF